MLNIYVNNTAQKEINYQITDLSSHTIEEGSLDSQKNLDLSSLSRGLYFLKLSSENETRTYKIVKK